MKTVKKNPNQRFVRIDTKSLQYHAYDGKKHLNTVASETPLDAEFVEYFRTQTDKVMESIDEQEGEGPEAA